MQQNDLFNGWIGQASRSTQVTIVQSTRETGNIYYYDTNNKPNLDKVNNSFILCVYIKNNAKIQT